MVVVTLSLMKLGAIAVKSMMAHGATAGAASTMHPLVGAAGTKAASLAGGHAATAMLASTAHATVGTAALAHHTVGTAAVAHHFITTHAALNAIQVHEGVTLAAVGAGSAVGAATLGAPVFERAFAIGFAAKMFDRQVMDRLDRRSLKFWFTTTGRTPKAGLGFTASGTMREGRFLPEPVPSTGPVTILQGVLSSDGSRVVRGRVVTVREALSGSLRRDHAASGIAVYGSVNPS